MKRPTLKASQMFGGMLIFLSFSLTFVLAGFIAGPKKSHKAHEKSIVDIEALMKRVMELNQKKEHQKAIDLLLQVVREQKEDSILRTLLVQTFDLFLEEEIKLGQKALHKNPLNMGHYNRVAGALELLGDNFHAMEILLNGIHYDQKAVDLWMKIARLELAANRNKEALDVFREVIRLDKKNSDAHNNAAYILIKATDCDHDDLKEAKNYAEIAHKLDPRNPEYIDTLAEISFKQGDSNSAKKLIEEAIKLAPENEAYKNQLIKFSPTRPLKAR